MFSNLNATYVNYLLMLRCIYYLAPTTSHYLQQKQFGMAERVWQVFHGCNPQAQPWTTRHNLRRNKQAFYWYEILRVSSFIRRLQKYGIGYYFIFFCNENFRLFKNIFLKRALFQKFVINCLYFMWNCIKSHALMWASHLDYQKVILLFDLSNAGSFKDKTKLHFCGYWKMESGSETEPGWCKWLKLLFLKVPVFTFSSLKIFLYYLKY